MQRPYDRQKLIVMLVILGLAASGAFYLGSVAQPMTSLLVPEKDLPAYHILNTHDLITTTLPTSSLPAKSLQQASDLAGRYTTQSLSVEKPVTEAQLVPIVDEKYVVDTTAVSIPATAAMAYNGQLTSGAIVVVWTGNDSGQAKELLEAVLVIDVQKVEGQSAEEKDPYDPYPYIIILAVPEGAREALLTAVYNQTLWLTIQHQ